MNLDKEKKYFMVRFMTFPKCVSVAVRVGVCMIEPSWNADLSSLQNHIRAENFGSRLDFQGGLCS